MNIFRLNKREKPKTFEEWLDYHGYFYIRTRKNKPCFKSNLTKKLKKKYKIERNLQHSKRFLFK
mgnify:CR=1 FL=1